MVPPHKRSFASDNYAGIHPSLLRAVEAANLGHMAAYGDDEVTSRAVAKFRERLGPTAEIFFVFNGTAANVLSLSALLRPYEAVICADTAHIQVDECGAPERFTGSKLLLAQTVNGKLTPATVAQAHQGVGNPHSAQPRVIAISQSTELGTVYTVAEIQALADFAHARSLYLYIDGARIANAAASLNVSLKKMLIDTGVDAFSFGGTKNGMLLGEAVVFLKPGLGKNFEFIRKQGMQLASKMRFIAAQFEAMFGDDLWLKNASHANAMAQYLAKSVRDIAEVKILHPVQSNAIFATLPRASIAPLQADFPFYLWNEERSEVRWMTSFDTTEPDIDAFVQAMKRALAKG